MTFWIGGKAGVILELGFAALCSSLLCVYQVQKKSTFAHEDKGGGKSLMLRTTREGDYSLLVEIRASMEARKRHTNRVVTKSRPVYPTAAIK